MTDAGGSGGRAARRVYLAGPPYADEYRRRAAALVRRIGWEPVDPMRRDFRGRTQGREAEIVEGDLAEIESCDAVLAAFTSPDEGTAMEAWYAHSLEKHVIASGFTLADRQWRGVIEGRVRAANGTRTLRVGGASNTTLPIPSFVAEHRRRRP